MAVKHATPAQQAAPITGQIDHKPPPPPDSYRVVDFVKAVAMCDDRGMEVRVNRVRANAPVDRESPMVVLAIVLNGTWFDIATGIATPADVDAAPTVARSYRVHVTNTVSAER